MTYYTESRKKANIKYAKNHLKRIPLDIDLEYYNNILKPYCEENGYTVNGFIKKILKEKIGK